MPNYRLLLTAYCLPPTAYCSGRDRGLQVLVGLAQPAKQRRKALFLLRAAAGVTVWVIFAGQRPERAPQFGHRQIRLEPRAQSHQVVERALLVRQERAPRTWLRTRRLPAPGVGLRRNSRRQVGIIEEEAERRWRHEPDARGFRDVRDRARFEPFLENLAEVDSASHTLGIGMTRTVLNPGAQTCRTLGSEDPSCARC